MKNFMLIFWKHPDEPKDQSIMGKVGPEWMEWMNTLKADGHLVDEGNPFSVTKVITKDDVTDGALKSPEDKVIICYCIIKASDLAQATDLAKSCPAIEPLSLSIEVHESMEMPAQS